MDYTAENHLGAKLAHFREEAQMSQARLCELMDRQGFCIKPYTISRWESGVSNPSVEEFLALCDILHVRDIRGAFAAKRTLRLYELPVSAGGGVYLNGEDFCELEVDASVPAEADYALRVRGDSMSPRFVDNQIIFIKKQEELIPGEIGIFLLSGESYVKKLGQGALLSLNPAYAPIPIGDASFKVLGKVIA